MIYAPSRACTLIQAGEAGRFVRITLQKRAGGIFWEGGVDSERLAYRCLKGEWPIFLVDFGSVPQSHMDV